MGITLPAWVLVLAMSWHACAGSTPPDAAAAAAAPPPSGAPSRPATAAVRVEGDLPRSGVLAVTDLERLGAVDVEWSVHGDAHAFRGVPLHAVLEHMGFTEGPGGSALPPTERRSGWRWVVQVWASDGFSAAFSAAELSPVMGATRAFLVWSQDGEPIPVAEGPLRLVVPSDRKGARCVRQVDRLTVVDLRGRTGRR